MRLIVQSCSKHQKPTLARCMESVLQYCDYADYDYQFFGDEVLFDCVPVEYRKQDVILQTDVARLFLIERLLHTYDQVIWCDADLYILDNRLHIPDATIVLANEAWIENGVLHKYPSNYIIGASKAEPLQRLFRQWEVWYFRAQRNGEPIKWYSFTTEVLRKIELSAYVEHTVNMSDDFKKRLLLDEHIPAMPDVYAANMKTSTNSTTEIPLIISKLHDFNNRIIRSAA